MKTITTGTKITFIETGDKFELSKTDTGFDVKRIQLSKSIPVEPYTFQELLDLHESGKITITGFEEGDGHLITSILTNYIHTTEIAGLKATIISHESVNAGLGQTNTSLLAEVDQLKADKANLTNINKDLELEVEKNKTEIKKLNAALEAMAD